MTGPGESVRITHGVDVVVPTTDRAYLIPCDDWDFLKEQVGRLTDYSWWLQFVGSLLLGGFATTVLSLGFGQVAVGARTTAVFVAGVTLVGGACLSVFAHREQKNKGTKASDVVRQMDLIENRYPSGGRRPSGSSG